MRRRFRPSVKDSFSLGARRLAPGQHAVQSRSRRVSLCTTLHGAVFYSKVAVSSLSDC